MDDQGSSIAVHQNLLDRAAMYADAEDEHSFATQEGTEGYIRRTLMARQESEETLVREAFATVIRIIKLHSSQTGPDLAATDGVVGRIQQVMQEWL